MSTTEELRIQATKKSIARVLSKGHEDYKTLFKKVQKDIGVGRKVFGDALSEMIGAKQVRKFRQKVDGGRRRFYELTEEGQQEWSKK